MCVYMYISANNTTVNKYSIHTPKYIPKSAKQKPFKEDVVNIAPLRFLK